MNAFVRFATSPSTCPAVIDSALRIPDVTGRKPVLTVPVTTPPATRGTLGCEPLKAAMRGADAAPEFVSHLPMATYFHRRNWSSRSSSFS